MGGLTRCRGRGGSLALARHERRTPRLAPRPGGGTVAAAGSGRCPAGPAGRGAVARVGGDGDRLGRPRPRHWAAPAPPDTQRAGAGLPAIACRPPARLDARRDRLPGGARADAPARRGWDGGAAPHGSVYGAGRRHGRGHRRTRTPRRPRIAPALESAGRHRLLDRRSRRRRADRSGRQAIGGPGGNGRGVRALDLDLEGGERRPDRGMGLCGLPPLRALDGGANNG